MVELTPGKLGETPTTSKSPLFLSIRVSVSRNKRLPATMKTEVDVRTIRDHPHLNDFTGQGYNTNITIT